MVRFFTFRRDAAASTRAADKRRRRMVALALYASLGCCGPLAAKPQPQPAIRIVVAPQAARTSTGSTLVVPTLAEAIALLERLRSEGAGGGALITLSGGVHRLDGPVRIDAAVNGPSGWPLVLRGAPDGSTRLSGAAPLTRIDRAPPPAGLDPAQRGRVLAYRLPAGAAAQPAIEVHRVHTAPAPPLGLELFDDAGALTPARWPNAGWARLRLATPDLASTAGVGAKTLQPAVGSSTSPVVAFRVPEGRAARWAGETDLWVAGYLGQDWSFETLPAVVAPPGSNSLTLAAPHYALRDNDRYVVENALAELDAPGEWWRDATHATVYLIPRRPGPVEVSVAAGLIDIDHARHVHLEGLTFERTRGDAVTVIGGDDIVLDDCTVRWTGGRGLVIGGATRSGLRRSVVADTGEGGVSLDGGDRASLTPAGNFVEDSVLVRFGRLGRTYKNAVTVDGVGMRVTGNVMAHAPHFAIRFQGNDHVIALNEIFDVANDTSDAGAIYTGRDIAAQGTRIANNFLHDIAPAPTFEVKGIYLDDMASGTTIDRNLFLRVDQPVFIGGGRDNRVTGNVFVASSPAFSLDGRGKVWPSPPITDPANPLRHAFDAVPATSAPWADRYPALSRLMQDDPFAAKRNLFRGNLLIGSSGAVIGQGADPRLQDIGDNRDAAAGGDPTRLASIWDAVVLAAAPLDPIAAALPLAQMDRRAVLLRIPDLRRRAGPLLAGESVP